MNSPVKSPQPNAASSKPKNSQMQKRTRSASRLFSYRIPRQHARNLVHPVNRIKRHNCGRGHTLIDLLFNPPMMRTQSRHLRRMGDNQNLPSITQ
jgi:hypothetical protein